MHVGAAVDSKPYKTTKEERRYHDRIGLGRIVGTGSVCWIKGVECWREGSVRNERVFLGQLGSERYPGAQGVIEAGCHSPWISRYLQERGWRVLIANPRKLRAIYEHERKSDRRDAQMLARIGRL